MTKFYTKDKKVRPISKRRISTGTYQTGTAHLNVPKTMSPKQATIPDYAVRELDLYWENDKPLYHISEAWSLNFARKMKSGKYNHDLALKGIRDNFVPEVVKKYRKEGYGDNPNFIEDYYLGKVSKADKEALAKVILPNIEEQAEYLYKNNYPSLKIQRG